MRSVSQSVQGNVKKIKGSAQDARLLSLSNDQSELSQKQSPPVRKSKKINLGRSPTGHLPDRKEPQKGAVCLERAAFNPPVHKTAVSETADLVTSLSSTHKGSAILAKRLV